MQIYVDMDGVLADFDRHYLAIFGYAPTRHGGTDWKAVRAHKGFYQSMPVMPDASVLWSRLYPRYRPIVLTGVSEHVPESEENKRSWTQWNLAPDTKIICCPAQYKFRHCLPGDLLIDDYEKHQQKWLDAGGIWITHTNAAVCAAWSCSRVNTLPV